MKKYIALLSVFLFFTILFAVAQIITAAAFSTDGMELNALEMQAQDIDRENTILKEKIYSSSSLTAIAQRAAQLGLSKNKKSRLVLSNPVPVALNQ